MPTFILGDSVLPITKANKWWTKVEEAPLQILAARAPYHCYVEKLYYWNISPRAQKLALCPFNINESAGLFSSTFDAEKTGTPCSFAFVAENTENTLLELELNPPLLLRRSENIGMWDQESGALNVVSTWKRTFAGSFSGSSDDHLGYFQASTHHFTGVKKVKSYLAYSTNWYVTFRRLTKEERDASKKKKKPEKTQPVLQLANSDEFERKASLRIASLQSGDANLRRHPLVLQQSGCTNSADDHLPELQLEPAPAGYKPRPVAEQQTATSTGAATHSAQETSSSSSQKKEGKRKKNAAKEGEEISGDPSLPGEGSDDAAVFESEQIEPAPVSLNDVTPKPMECSEESTVDDEMNTTPGLSTSMSREEEENQIPEIAD
ncbi:unnamed protein product [Amoebophrya sp. A120]|nr:unnamed protein product [Amoebophrya sp. A120]|eukprot:GSA120T00019148001.1